MSPALPDDIYQQVLALNPFLIDPGTPYGDPSWTSRLTFPQKYDHRHQIDLLPVQASPQELVWRDMAEAFGVGPWWGETLRTRFPDYFSIRFGDAMDLPDIWDSLDRKVFLQRHDPGFELAAHPDIPTRIATAIFSFADREGFDHCGTQLLAPRDPPVRCWGNKHHPIDGFTVVGVAPYRPNSCLVFFKTRRAWHSVSPEAGLAPNGRFGMQAQLYEPDGGLFEDLSTPDLMMNKQFIADTPPPPGRWTPDVSPGRWLEPSSTAS